MKVAFFFPHIPLPQKNITELQRRFPKVHFTYISDPAKIASSLADVDILCAPLITQTMLRAALKLRWFHSISIQFGEMVESSVFETKIQITNSRGVHAQASAEKLTHALEHFFHGVHLTGKTIGIIGYGGNGKCLAKSLRHRGMRVVAAARGARSSDEIAERIVSSDEIFTIIPECDAIAITAPLTEETRGMVNSDFLKQIKPKAVIVSNSRPQLFDEAAVMESLRRGKLCGIALDELLRADSPLRQEPKVMIIHHIRPTDEGYWERSLGFFAEQLQRFLSKQPLLNVMHRDLKY